MRLRKIAAFMTVLVLVGGIAEVAGAKPRRRNSSVRILSVTSTEITGRVNSRHAPCERSRDIDVFVDGAFVDSTTSNGNGTWSILANVDDDDRIDVTMLKLKRRNTVCTADTDSATANLPTPVRHTLTVSPSAGGRVDSNPAGISNCRAASGICSANYDSGTFVGLTATPDADQQFAGWGGACAGQGQCIVEMDANRTVTASFTPTGTPPTPDTCSVPTDVPEPIRGLLCTILGLLGT